MWGDNVKSSDELLAEARETGYIEARENVFERFVAALWRLECEAAYRPFVWVCPKITRGVVILDMEPSGCKFNAAGFEAVKRAILATPGAPALGGYRFGNFTHVPGLYLQHCHALAVALLKIATAEEYLEAVSEGKVSDEDQN